METSIKRRLYIGIKIDDKDKSKLNAGEEISSTYSGENKVHIQAVKSGKRERAFVKNNDIEIKIPYNLLNSPSVESSNLSEENFNLTYTDKNETGYDRIEINLAYPRKLE